MPRMQTFNHPPPRFATRMQRQTLIASVLWCNVSRVVLPQHYFVRRSIIVGGIQAQVLRCGTRRHGAHDRLIVQQGLQQRTIVDVGSRHHDGERDSSSIAQKMVFNSRFGTIRRIRTAFFFPPAASARKCRHQLATPSQCHAPGHTDRDTAARWLQTHRLSPTRQNDHKRSATHRTPVAARATAHPSTECTAWRLGGDGRRHADARLWRARAQVEAKLQSRSTSHLELCVVLA